MNLKKKIERIKNNAYADECSTYAAKKNNLYNVKVIDAVDDFTYNDIESKYRVEKDIDGLRRFVKR